MTPEMTPAHFPTFSQRICHQNIYFAAWVFERETTENLIKYRNNYNGNREFKGTNAADYEAFNNMSNKALEYIRRATDELVARGVETRRPHIVR